MVRYGSAFLFVSTVFKYIVLLVLLLPLHLPQGVEYTCSENRSSLPQQTVVDMPDACPLMPDWQEVTTPAPFWAQMQRDRRVPASQYRFPQVSRRNSIRLIAETLRVTLWWADNAFHKLNIPACSIGFPFHSFW